MFHTYSWQLLANLELLLIIPANGTSGKRSWAGCCLRGLLVSKDLAKRQLA
jgi:hypothetical protein